MELKNIKYSEIFKFITLVILAMTVCYVIVTFSFNLAEKVKIKNDINELTKEKLRLEIKVQQYQLNKLNNGK